MLSFSCSDVYANSQAVGSRNPLVIASENIDLYNSLRSTKNLFSSDNRKTQISCRNSLVSILFPHIFYSFIRIVFASFELYDCVEEIYGGNLLSFWEIVWEKEKDVI